MDPTPEIVAVQEEYMRLADRLWTGFEPIEAQPMKDRDLFEFLGFD
jgi:light-independent protochlorophyllide reductase subunit L